MPQIEDSTNLAAAEWKDGVLTIEFRKGQSYEYYDVPNGLYQEFMTAPHRHTFFVDNIKGKFTYARI